MRDALGHGQVVGPHVTSKYGFNIIVLNVIQFDQRNVYNKCDKNNYSLLASSSFGKLQLGLQYKNGILEVEVIRAKELIARNTKSLPCKRINLVIFKIIWNISPDNNSDSIRHISSL